MLQDVLSRSGPLEFFMALGVGSIALIPGFVAFPLASLLRENGASTPVLAAGCVACRCRSNGLAIGMSKLGKALSVANKSWPWIMMAVVIGLWGYGRIGGTFAFGLWAGESLYAFLIEMALVLPPMFLLAMVQAGPLYGALPVAVSLWRKGCAPRNVFIYLGAFAAMKIPMLTLEVAFLGWSFSLARTLITLPVFIVVGFVLEKLLPAGFQPPALSGFDAVASA
jgi:hypothetical protein